MTYGFGGYAIGYVTTVTCGSARGASMVAPPTVAGAPRP